METLTYKVLLVDDEEEVMDVIEHKIDWEQCGFTVIGRAQNGLKALEIAEALYLTCSYDIFKEAKKAAEEEAKNTVFDAEDKAKKEAQSIAKDGEANVASLKEKAMANVDDAASIIVKNVL